MTRQRQIPLGRQEVLYQPVGRGEEDRPVRLHQPVAHGTQCVCLAGARQSEGQDVDAATYEVTVGQFAQLLSQAQGHPVMLEGLPSLASGQPGLLAESVDPPLPSILGLLLQHLQEGGQGVAVASGGEAVHRLRPHGGQLELMAQLPDPVVYRHGVDHQATPASRES